VKTRGKNSLGVTKEKNPLKTERIGGARGETEALRLKDLGNEIQGDKMRGDRVKQCQPLVSARKFGHLIKIGRKSY